MMDFVRLIYIPDTSNMPFYINVLDKAAAPAGRHRHRQHPPDRQGPDHRSVRRLLRRGNEDHRHSHFPHPLPPAERRQVLQGLRQAEKRRKRADPPDGTGRNGAPLLKERAGRAEPGPDRRGAGGNQTGAPGRGLPPGRFREEEGQAGQAPAHAV